VKITKDTVGREPADLSRRSFFWSVLPPPGLALATPLFRASWGKTRRSPLQQFRSQRLYSITPDGIVTVTCGKADMGQQILPRPWRRSFEELGSNEDMRVQLASTIRNSTTRAARRLPAAAGAR